MNNSRIQHCRQGILIELMLLLSIGLVSCNAVMPESADVQVTLSADLSNSAVGDARVEAKFTTDLAKETYFLGEPITVTIQWRVTRGWLIALSTQQFYDYKISLSNNRGAPVPYTVAGQNLCDQIGYWRCDSEDEIFGGGSRAQYRLDAEKSASHQVLYLSEWFDISATGAYTLMVTTRNVINSSAMQAGLESQTRFVSQPITFTVIAP